MSRNICGIYMFEYLKTGEKYIGQSVDCLRRYNKHLSAARNPKNSEYDTRLHRTIRKHGIEAFRFEILEECSKEELNAKEIYYIDKFDSKNNGFNNTFGGGCTVTVTAHKLKSEDIEEIFHLLTDTDEKITDIAKKFGVSHPVVSDINNGRTWTDSKKLYPLRSRRIVEYICPSCGAKMCRSSNLCRNCASLDRGFNKGSYIEKDGITYSTHDIESLLLKYKSFTKVGEVLGCSRVVISRFCKKNNISVEGTWVDESERKKEITKNDIVSAGNMTGWKIKEMSKILKIIPETIRIKMTEFNLMEAYHNAHLYKVILTQGNDILSFDSLKDAAIFIKEKENLKSKNSSIESSLRRAANKERDTYLGYEVQFERSPLY